MKRGALVAFEGLDGSGKSTQLARAAAVLRAAGYDVLETCEPTDGPTGRRIREMARSGERVAPEEELRWFVEDRREHVERVLVPALAAGRVALTDRYTLSSAAYQGARGLDPESILRAGEATFPLPDLALVFEIDPDRALERIRQRGSAPEPAFERADYLARVAAIFAAIDRPYVERIAAGGEPGAVHALVMAALRRRLELAGAPD